MNNQLIDLNNHLFAQIERLGDESLKGEDLTAELKRAKGISHIAKDVVSNARLVLDAEVAKAEYQLKSDLPMMEHKSGE
ncbi:MAG: hypothetical protein OQK32_00460 [Gammaproteobacteria bacterium]|nr:hypothetical protein [Gammaproteobacteria bacterium]MCW8924088.1 hypothetical protein [Gammaproteobacteria bacterium]